MDIYYNGVGILRELTPEEMEDLSVPEGVSVEDHVRMYLKEIGKVPLLSNEEEMELAKRMAEGEEDAKKCLAEANLRLVVSIAKEYRNNHLDYMDLIMEGNQGLLVAVEKFNPDLGYRFSTCATPWIKQAILKAITDKGKSIRLPAHIYAQLNKMRDVLDDFDCRGNLTPTDAEIAAAMGIDVERVVNLKVWKKDAISLNLPIGDEDKTTLEDMVEATGEESPVDYTERQLRHENLEKALSKFPERTQTIIKMRFGLGNENDPEEYSTEHTLEEIGAYLGLTRERVRQIEKQTLQDIKNSWGK